MSTKSKAYVGIDIGTSGVKALAIDGRGRIIGSANSSLNMSAPKPGWAEQNPADWVKAAAKASRALLKILEGRNTAVDAIGLTGQMHSAVFLDSKMQVIRPAILWCDGRCVAECGEITQRVGSKKLLKLARNIALPGFTAPKIIWLRNHERSNYRKVAHVLLAKDYIRYVMSRSLATDVSDASGMLLLDVAKRRWADEILAALDIPRSWLGQVFESQEITGQVSREGAKLFGFKEGTPIVAGGGDQAAGALGSGIISEGDALITLGTSGVVFAARGTKPAPATDTVVHSFCHAVPGLWHTMGVMLSAAGSLKWFRDTLAPHMTYSQIDRMASKAPVGSNGIIFRPYLAGERTPLNDPNARAEFVGMSLANDFNDMARAVLEGVAFGIRDCVDAMKAAGVNPKQYYLAGGGAKSRLWAQIVADTLGVNLKRMKTEEGPSMGAATLAGIGAGAFKDASSTKTFTLKIKGEIKYNREANKILEEAFEIYKSSIK